MENLNKKAMKCGLPGELSMVHGIFFCNIKKKTHVFLKLYSKRMSYNFHEYMLT